MRLFRQINFKIAATLATTVFISLITAGIASGQLTIEMNYDDFINNPPPNLSSILRNDDWDASTTDAERIDAAIAIMDQAAANIEAMFADCTSTTITQPIDIFWFALNGNTFAQGGTAWNDANELDGGGIRWDSDGTTSFFVDLTPTMNEEYTASPNDSRTSNFGGIDINVENIWYANFLGTDADQFRDMLSIATHELMHALGIVVPYPNYLALDSDGDGFLDLVADENMYEVPYLSGHTIVTLPWNGLGMLSGDYYPNTTGRFQVPGTRRYLTDLDALVLANVLGFAADDFACVNQPLGTIPVAVPEVIVPQSFTVTRGTLAQGGAAELDASDNIDVSIRRSTSDVFSRTEFEVQAVSPTDSPSTFDITLEGSVFARTTVNQTIELWDFSTSAWEVVDMREAMRFSDSIAAVSPTGDLSRFVEQGVGTILARVRFNSVRARQRFASNTDLFTWSVQ